MFFLNVLGFLFVVGLLFGVKNLLLDLWRDSTLVDRWVRGIRY